MRQQGERHRRIDEDSYCPPYLIHNWAYNTGQ